MISGFLLQLKFSVNTLSSVSRKDLKIRKYKNQKKNVIILFMYNIPYYFVSINHSLFEIIRKCVLTLYPPSSYLFCTVF